MARIKRPAVMVDCPGLQDGKYAHAMRDHCWSCAPFWERIPTCPDDGRALSLTGYCKTCRKHFSRSEVSA
jgi:hypothetical protein